MATWLMKTEPTGYSIDDLQRDGQTDWTGVRNYWARNFMQAMKVGERVLLYHSNAKPSGAVGVAKVVARAHPDRTQFDPKSKYFDAKSKIEHPTWHCVDIAFVARFKRIVPLSELNDDPQLAGMMLTTGQGSRVSVQPMEKAHFDHIVRLGNRE